MSTPGASRTAVPLESLLAGARARVASIASGHGGRRRLAELGIRTGRELTVIRSGPGGPVIVEALGTRLVLGRGIAHHVMVERLDAASCAGERVDARPGTERHR